MHDQDSVNLTLCGCDFFFDHEYRVWSFGSEPCNYGHPLNCKLQNILAREANNDKSAHQNNDMSRRQRKELLFFTQAFMNSLIYAIMLICLHLISRVVRTDFGLFLCTTFIWGLSHAGGG
ncbi:hypothetical protein ANCDUO_23035 [Ancylostoma duodenale]|uniref:7TM GPCR serpentine receptor class x (Srx) domain-containing protein n=1 Tax=Ancylostoma duodenale TaxID=51022 RepID=A0A0C2FJJ5_9BILA|nr:hypothetical protein ANCDUO_23035 [Ancylostoma duodenale]